MPVVGHTRCVACSWRVLYEVWVVVWPEQGRRRVRCRESSNVWVSVRVLVKVVWEYPPPRHPPTLTVSARASRILRESGPSAYRDCRLWMTTVVADGVKLSFLRLQTVMFSAIARRRVLVRASVWRTPGLLHPRWASTVASPNLNSVTEEDLAHFSTFLTPPSILSTLSPSNTSADELSAFNNDWMGKYKGKSTTVLKPRTTEEVSKIVKYCNEKRIGIVPQGGNTGLVGGSVPVKDEVILSLSNLNKIRSFDPVSGTVTSFVPRLSYLVS